MVPDQAITSAGRTVQCGSCGNKWKQFPVISEENEVIEKKVKIKTTPTYKKIPNVSKVTKLKKKKAKKTREINLYSPEYLEKKHGINLNKISSKDTTVASKKVSFGFYNSLLLLVLIIIVISRGLYFFQDFIIQFMPASEFYLNYFFESIRNMFEIWKNLISSY